MPKELKPSAAAARRVKLTAKALDGSRQATRTVKVSEKTAQRLKAAAAVLNCTQQEVVEMAIEKLWPEVSQRLAELD
ncbi:MAG: hypothetical protein K8I27_08435 [Planctomycetes bacterium]|nr:hypothetical protein [Planctomycetota bacterium]